MAQNALPKPPIRLTCVEVSSFRRLARVRLDLEEATTVLVGANNSGKTSLLTVLRNFLAERSAFRAYDLSMEHWPKLRDLAEVWEGLAEDPITNAKEADNWPAQLATLVGCMPVADLWFDASEGAYHHVEPFLTSLQWAGGPVGLRLRVEPASTVEELQALAWRYREARAPVSGLDKKGHAWPIDLLDYWLRYPADLRRISAYRLDPNQGPATTGTKTSMQSLPTGAQPIDLAHLRQLIRVDLVPAQRGLGAEEDESRSESGGAKPGLFSSQLLKFARQHLNVVTSGKGNSADLIAAIAKAQGDLDDTISTALAPSIKDVSILGYPSLHDPQKIRFRTRIETADLLAHNTAVQYQLDEKATGELLPEHSIGLGYQNLQSLSFQLVSFRAARLNPPKGHPAPVHLVMLEEPEAHLHVQVQRVFPAKAYGLICPQGELYSNLSSQLLISTHSSHLAHADSFTHLRYVRRVPRKPEDLMAKTEVVNLGNAFGTDTETRTFAERYFRVQHADLLFSDAAIFVEGTAERMVIPLFIERDFPGLGRKYVSLLDIGGSHAHRLRPLVERLGIPTAVVTDLDPVIPTVTKKGRTVRAAVHIAGQANLECGNDTLTSWHPKIQDFKAFAKPNEAELEWISDSGAKVRFAWQVPVAAASNAWPSSFEDSLVLSNIAWFQSLDTKKDAVTGASLRPKGAMGKVVDTVTDHPKHEELLEALHGLLHSSFSKGDFAATIFENITNGEPVSCPAYIADALTWLEKQLVPTVEKAE